ncbi:MAG: efflux RND transporter periplasmic adaptor subunit [Pseudomonadota bacterium]
MNRKSTKARVVTTAIAVAIASATTFAISAALHARVANADRNAGVHAMPVSHDRFELQSGYQREHRYLGLIQAATRSFVGFEVPGALEQIHVREGQRVDAGTALATLNSDALSARQAAAAATVEQVAAELELARARTVRQAPLRDTGAISAQSFDDTRLAEKALVSALASARANLRTIDIELEKSVLRAPYAAIVGRQLLDRGAVTQPGSPVFSLVSTAEREAHIGIAIEKADNLVIGESYPLRLRGDIVSAQLRAVRPDVNPITMTTVAIFDLPSGLNAFDGEPVAVGLPQEETEIGGWVPLSALIEGDRGVWSALAIRESDEGTYTERAAVEVMHVAEDQAYVRGTLVDGDLIVADGVHRIAPGTLVSINSSHKDDRKAQIARLTP